MDSSENVVKRSLLEILEASLNDHSDDLCAENEVRYKLIIDSSEDESIIRQLFAFGILKRETTRVLACTKFPGDLDIQKVCKGIYAINTQHCSSSLSPTYIN